MSPKALRPHLAAALLASLLQLFCEVTRRAPSACATLYDASALRNLSAFPESASIRGEPFRQDAFGLQLRFVFSKCIDVFGAGARNPAVQDSVKSTVGSAPLSSCSASVGELRTLALRRSAEISTSVFRHQRNAEVIAMWSNPISTLEPEARQVGLRHLGFSRCRGGLRVYGVGDAFEPAPDPQV